MVGWRWHFSSLSVLGSRQSSHSYSNSLVSGQVLYCSGPNRPSRKLFLWNLKVDVERGEIKYGNGISSFSLTTMNAFSFIIEKKDSRKRWHVNRHFKHVMHKTRGKKIQRFHFVNYNFRQYENKIVINSIHFFSPDFAAVRESSLNSNKVER